MVPSSGRLPPPPWYGPGRSIGPGTWHAFTAPSLGYVPSMFAFVPALSRVPCKYHRILHHLQRLRLHQPAFPPIHNHPPTPTGAGQGTMTIPGGGVGLPRAVPIYTNRCITCLVILRPTFQCKVEMLAGKTLWPRSGSYLVYDNITV